MYFCQKCYSLQEDILYILDGGVGAIQNEPVSCTDFRHIFHNDDLTST